MVDGFPDILGDEVGGDGIGGGLEGFYHSCEWGDGVMEGFVMAAVGHDDVRRVFKGCGGDAVDGA